MQNGFLIRTSSVDVVVLQVGLDGAGEFEDVTPLVFVQDSVPGLIQELEERIQEAPLPA